MRPTYFIFSSSDLFCLFFFFNDTATTEIYTLSLHDALPIFEARRAAIVSTRARAVPLGKTSLLDWRFADGDRKSTRLNSSHSQKSYAAFFFKKKKNNSTISSVLSPIQIHSFPGSFRDTCTPH